MGMSRAVEPDSFCNITAYTVRVSGTLVRSRCAMPMPPSMGSFNRNHQLEPTFVMRNMVGKVRQP